MGPVELVGRAGAGKREVDDRVRVDAPEAGIAPERPHCLDDPDARAVALDDEGGARITVAAGDNTAQQEEGGTHETGERICRHCHFRSTRVGDGGPSGKRQLPAAYGSWSRHSPTVENAPYIGVGAALHVEDDMGVGPECPGPQTWQVQLKPISGRPRSGIQGDAVDCRLERTDKAQCDIRSSRFQIVVDGLVHIALGRFPEDCGPGSHAFERRRTPVRRDSK